MTTGGSEGGTETQLPHSMTGMTEEQRQRDRETERQTERESTRHNPERETVRQKDRENPVGKDLYIHRHV